MFLNKFEYILIEFLTTIRNYTNSFFFTLISIQLIAIMDLKLILLLLLFLLISIIVVTILNSFTDVFAEFYSYELNIKNNISVMSYILSMFSNVKFTFLNFIWETFDFVVCNTFLTNKRIFNYYYN